MNWHLQIIPHTLQFRFDARTSRGAMQEHQVYYFKLFAENRPDVYGLGECAPLPGLSPEWSPDFFQTITKQIAHLNQQLINEPVTTLKSMVQEDNWYNFPSVAFALETALLDLKNGGKRIFFENNFTQANAGIPINGLIWMGDKSFMQEQIKQKLDAGFRCLKLKIGGIDFDSELTLLQQVRQIASPQELIIRLDANGSFSESEALAKIRQLAAFSIHSIEQPIQPGQWEAMQHLCRHSPIPIALDEELINITSPDQRIALLETLKPAYIILKPTLLGGLKATAAWIQLSQARNIDWWITSALESNIGLNAISQFTAQYPVEREQGLGTGQLYLNNPASPLGIHKGKLFYDQNQSWDLSLFDR